MTWVAMMHSFIEGLAPTLGSERNKYHVSLKSWATYTNRLWRQDKVNSWLRTKGIYDWLHGMPSKSNMKAHVEYLFNKDSLLNQCLKFFASRPYKQLRRDKFISKQRAIKLIVDKLLRSAKVQKGQQLVVAIGDARFSQLSRGFMPGANQNLLYKHLEKRPHIHPIYVSEYHTSQVCSCCAFNWMCGFPSLIYKVAGLKSKQDVLSLSEGSGIRPVDNFLACATMSRLWQDLQSRHQFSAKHDPMSLLSHHGLGWVSTPVVF